MLESKFQRDFKKRLKTVFPGCIILKNDPNNVQGIPDLLLLYLDRWAALEIKRTRTAAKRPNQEYYITKLNSMGYAAIVFPENEEDVIDDLVDYFL